MPISVLFCMNIFSTWNILIERMKTGWGRFVLASIISTSEKVSKKYLNVDIQI
jgi:hypothetical protein